MTTKEVKEIKASDNQDEEIKLEEDDFIDAIADILLKYDADTFFTENNSKAEKEYFLPNKVNDFLNKIPTDYKKSAITNLLTTFQNKRKGTLLHHLDFLTRPELLSHCIYYFNCLSNEKETNDTLFQEILDSRATFLYFENTKKKFLKNNEYYNKIKNTYGEDYVHYEEIDKLVETVVVFFKNSEESYVFKFVEKHLMEFINLLEYVNGFEGGEKVIAIKHKIINSILAVFQYIAKSSPLFSKMFTELKTVFSVVFIEHTNDSIVTQNFELISTFFKNKEFNEDTSKDFYLNLTNLMNFLNKNIEFDPLGAFSAGFIVFVNQFSNYKFNLKNLENYESGVYEYISKVITAFSNTKPSDFKTSQQTDIISRICLSLINFNTLNFLKIKQKLLPTDDSFSFLKFLEEIQGNNKHLKNLKKRTRSLLIQANIVFPFYLNMETIFERKKKTAEKAEKKVTTDQPQPVVDAEKKDENSKEIDDKNTAIAIDNDDNKAKKKETDLDSLFDGDTITDVKNNLIIRLVLQYKYRFEEYKKTFFAQKNNLDKENENFISKWEEILSDFKTMVVDPAFFLIHFFLYQLSKTTLGEDKVYLVNRLTILVLSFTRDLLSCINLEGKSEEWNFYDKLIDIIEIDDPRLKIVKPEKKVKKEVKTFTKSLINSVVQSAGSSTIKEIQLDAVQDEPRKRKVLRAKEDEKDPYEGFKEFIKEKISETKNSLMELNKVTNNCKLEQLILHLNILFDVFYNPIQKSSKIVKKTNSTHNKETEELNKRYKFITDNLNKFKEKQYANMKAVGTSKLLHESNKNSKIYYNNIFYILLELSVNCDENFINKKKKELDEHKINNNNNQNDQNEQESDSDEEEESEDEDEDDKDEEKVDENKSKKSDKSNKSKKSKASSKKEEENKELKSEEVENKVDENNEDHKDNEDHNNDEVHKDNEDHKSDENNSKKSTSSRKNTETKNADHDPENDEKEKEDKVEELEDDGKKKKRNKNKRKTKKVNLDENSDENHQNENNEEKKDEEVVNNENEVKPEESNKEKEKVKEDLSYVDYGILESVVSLASTETYYKYLQHKMVSNSSRFSVKLKYLLEVEIPNLMQILIISFKSSKPDITVKDKLLSCIEFVRLHCEGYNKYFKSYLTVSNILKIQQDKDTSQKSKDDKGGSGGEDANNNGENVETISLTFGQLCLKFYYKLLQISREYIVKLKAFSISKSLQKDLNSIVEVNNIIAKFLIEITQGNFDKNFEKMCKKDFFLPITIEVNSIISMIFENFGCHTVTVCIELIYTYLGYLNCILDEYQTLKTPININDIFLSSTDLTHLNHLAYLKVLDFKRIFYCIRYSTYPDPDHKYFTPQNIGKELYDSYVLHDLVIYQGKRDYDSPIHKEISFSTLCTLISKIDILHFVKQKEIYLEIKENIYFKLGCLTYQIILTLYKITKEVSNWNYYNNFADNSHSIFLYDEHKYTLRNSTALWKHYVKSVEVTVEKDIYYNEQEFNAYSDFMPPLGNYQNYEFQVYDDEVFSKLILITFVAHEDIIYYDEKKYNDWSRENNTIDLSENLKSLVHYSKTTLKKEINSKKTMINKNYDKFYEVYDNTERNELYSFLFSIVCNCILIAFMTQHMEVDLKTGEQVSTPYMNIFIWVLFWLFNLAHIAWNSYCMYNYYFVVTYLKHEKYDDDSFFVNLKNLLIHLFVSNKTRMLFINELISLIAIFKTPFFIPLQLFLCYKFSDTLKMLIFAIKIKFMDFASALLLMLMIVLFYSSLSVYFFTNEIVSDSGDYICNNFFTCFFYLNSNGLRTGTGLNFTLKSMSTDGYWKELIVDWTFFFLLVLVMANIINAIIVDLFQKLSEEQELKALIFQQQCMICSINEDEFKMKRLDYRTHLEEVHNVHVYLLYFYYLDQQSNEDLSKSNYTIKRMLENDKTLFFPINMTFGFESSNIGS